MRKKNKTIGDLIRAYFKKHKGEELPHGPVVDWVEEQYVKLGNKKPRDIWRNIRSLHQQGYLVKVRKGVYKYDPQAVKRRKIKDFTQVQKRAALKRGKYKCAVCGRGVKDGIELHVDHIRPKELGGRSVVENAQVLCSKHNLLKKKFQQTETGKRMFINLYKLAKKERDKELVNFCRDVLRMYERHDINDHIEWKE